MKRFTILRAALAAAFAFAAGCAMAQNAGSERAQKAIAELKERFASADLDGDGRLTKDEAKDKMPMVYKNFEAIDVNHVGSVSLADIAAYVRSRSSERKKAR